MTHTPFDPAVDRRGPRPPEPEVDLFDAVIAEHMATTEAAIERAQKDFARLEGDERGLARR